MNEALLVKSRKFKELKELKSELDAQSKELGKQIEDMEKELVGDMLDQDVTKFVHDGYSYSLNLKTYYNIKAEDREVGFPLLRELGLGELITERLDDRTLTNTLNQIAEENSGELPEEYAELPLSTYDRNKVNIRKETKKNGKR